MKLTQETVAVLVHFKLVFHSHHGGIDVLGQSFIAL